MFVEQVFKIGAVTLERSGIHVGQIVGDHVQLGLHGIHAGSRGVESLHAHLFCPFTDYKIGNELFFAGKSVFNAYESRSIRPIRLPDAWS